MSKPRLCIILMSLMTVSSAATAEIRTWTDRTGKHQVRAELIGVDDDKITCIGYHGKFCVPTSANGSILPSDGTPILQDAEYYCFVRVDSRISID